MSKIINVKVSQRPKQVNTKWGERTVAHFLNQEANASKSQREIVALLNQGMILVDAETRRH